MYRFIALCLSFLCCFGMGFNVHANGNVLKNVNDSNSELEKDSDFKIVNGILVSYTGNDEIVTIPDSVKKIDDKVFYNNQTIKKVIFPNSLEIIGNYAFYNCNNLTDLEFPSSLKEIGYDSFYGTNIKSLFIPNAVSEIGENAFSNCTSLENVTFEGGNYKYIYIDHSFARCTNLKKVEFKNKNAYAVFNYGVFAGDTNLETVVLPNMVAFYGDGATFKNCFNLKEIYFPNNVESISKNLFDYQTNLTIYGYTNSSVEQYAKEHNIPFVSLGIASNNVVVNNVSDKKDDWYAGYFTIKVGEKYKLDVTTSPVEHADSPFFRNWNSDIISIDDNGVVKGLKAGEGTLSIYFNNNHKNLRFIVVDDYPSHHPTIDIETDSKKFFDGSDNGRINVILTSNRNELHIYGEPYSLNSPLKFSYDGPDGLKYEIQDDKVILKSVPVGEYTFKITTRDGATSKLDVRFKQMATDFDCPEEVYVPAGVDKVEARVSLKSEYDYGYIDFDYSDIDCIYFDQQYCERIMNSSENIDYGGVGEVTANLYDDYWDKKLIASKKIKVKVDGWSSDFNNYYLKGKLATGWQIIDGKTYYFKNGKYVDFKKIDNDYYYFNNMGEMQTGWQYIDSVYRYFNSDGKMARATIVDNKYVDDDGKLVTNQFVNYKGDTYYVQYDGNIVTGLYNVDFVDYYFDEDGKMVKDTFIGDKYFNHDGKYVANQWISNPKGWKYKLGDGTYIKSNFKKINDATYYFNSNGYMLTGWQKIKDNYYFFNTSGAMVTNAWIGNYYLGSDGIMLTNTFTPDGYYVDANGVWSTSKWIQSGNRWWYRHYDGTCTTNDFEVIENQTYYFDTSGYMVTGWQKINDKFYYFNASGAMVKNTWVGNYYLGSDGIMLTNTFTPDGYYVDANGVWSTSKWIQSGNRWWYRHYDGTYTTNDFEVIGNQTYYFDSNGYMLTGWQKIKGNYYFFNTSGAMVTNAWVGNYYLGSDGIMLTNTTTPDGHHVGADGAWMQ